MSTAEMAANIRDDELQPIKQFTPSNEIKLTKKDMMSFITATTMKGLVRHNTDGFNELTTGGGIDRIMRLLFDVDRRNTNERADQPIDAFRVRIQFHDVKIGRPTCTVYITGQFTDLYPNTARITGQPYSGAVTLGATVTVQALFADGHTEEHIAEVPSVHVGNFPIMVGSELCHTHNCTREGLKAMGEDPTDAGGYFIADGEWIVDLLENIRYNSPLIYPQMKANEHVRLEFLSQPNGAFENSSQIRVRFMLSGQITIEINSQKIEKAKLPFFIIYRLFGMTSDKDVANTIVLDTEDKSPFTLKTLEVLQKAFHTVDAQFNSLLYEVDHAKIVQMTAEQVTKYITSRSSYQTNEAAVQYMTSDLMRTLDRVLLPHMGQNEAARIKKLRFLGLLIRKMFMVWLKVLPPTDRDSYSNKRVHGAGVSLAKAFKTQVNNGVVGPISRAIRRELKTTPWKSITPKTFTDIFRNALATSDLNKAMVQAITSGKSTIVVKKRAATNRISSQPLERKSELNTQSALRTVVTQNTGNASKQTERASDMRMPHPSMLGYICVAQSADTGENVGTKKQLALTAGVCSAGDALPLKLRLLSDSKVVPLEIVTGKDQLRMACIYINGELIGCCESAHELCTRYRKLRREGRAVDPHTTIYWNTVANEVEFWLDVGRLYRPIIIVDNNIDEYDASVRAGKPIEFIQNIQFTPFHAREIVAGRMSLDDLIAEGIAEYITPEEQENCYIAESVTELIANKNNPLKAYSHVDVEQAIFGLAAHLSPFGNHTQPARVTYETNQGRQTGGWYALNFPWRKDKNRFFQFNNEIPLVRTITHGLVPSNGMNVVIAYKSYTGDNQEDSAVVCQASADRGLFAGAFFRFEQAELEKGEMFCTPNPLTTKNLRPGACYEKLVNGLIQVGSTVVYGDVLIGRVAKIIRGKSTDDNFLYTDRSIVYRLHEPAIVEDVMMPRGGNDEVFCIVKLRYERPLRTGDKLSSRSGNKSIAARMMQQSDMPFTEDGLTPDLIINNHSFPSRMTIGQLIEGIYAQVCANIGSIADGTAFLPVDHEAMFDRLHGIGARYNGRSRMYNGMTGEYFDCSIFIVPTFEQRLQKFVLDDEQSVAGSGPTDAVTGQPLGGKHVQGGLRIGEMENWALESHGSMMNLFEKCLQDSDRRTMWVCRGCGLPAAYNAEHSIYNCKNCGEMADIAAVESCKTAILLHEELAASNVQVRLGLKPREFETELGDTE